MFLPGFALLCFSLYTISVCNIGLYVHFLFALTCCSIFLVCILLTCLALLYFELPPAALLWPALPCSTLTCCALFPPDNLCCALLCFALLWPALPVLLWSAVLCPPLPYSSLFSFALLWLALPCLSLLHLALPTSLAVAGRRPIAARIGGMDSVCVERHRCACHMYCCPLATTGEIEDELRTVQGGGDDLHLPRGRGQLHRLCFPGGSLKRAPTSQDRGATALAAPRVIAAAGHRTCRRKNGCMIGPCLPCVFAFSLLNLWFWLVFSCSSLLFCFLVFWGCITHGAAMVRQLAMHMARLGSDSRGIYG